MTITWNHDEPLAKAEGETRKANDALMDYWLMGPGRSQLKLWNSYLIVTEPLPPTRRLPTIKGWSIDYQWQARVNRAKEIQDTADLAEWERCRFEVRQGDWELGNRLRDVANEIVDHAPKFYNRTKKFIKGKDGQPDREIITIQLDYHAAAKTAKLASDLQRQAAEVIAITRTELTGKDGQPIETRDVSDFTDEERMKRIAALLKTG